MLAKISAFGSYFVQSLFSIGLSLLVSRLLPHAQYALFSTDLALAQLVSLIAFETVRLSAARFYSGDADTGADARLSNVMMLHWGLGLLVTMIGTALFVLIGNGRGIGWVFAVYILMQGTSDLQFLLLRIKKCFTLFSRLQSLRAALQMAGACAGAYWRHDAVTALGAMAAVHLLTVAAAWLLRPDMMRFKRSELTRPDIARLVRYGGMACAASGVHLCCPLMIRGVAMRLMTADRFAGLALTMDLLQRPFNVIMAALWGVLYPSVVGEHEAAPQGPHLLLRRLYRIETYAVALMFGFGVAYARDIATLMISPSLAAPFIAYAIPILTFYALHAMIQVSLATAGHLAVAGGRLVRNGVIECVSVSVICLVPCFVFRRPDLIAPLGALGAFIALLLSVPTLKLVAFRFPWRSWLTAWVVGGLMACLYWLPLHTIWLSLAVKSACGAVLILPIAFDYFVLSNDARATHAPLLAAC